MVEPKKFIEYIYNDTVTFKCAAGYMLKGPKTLTYQAKDGTQNVFGIITGPLVYMNASCKCSMPYFSLLMYEHNLMLFNIIDICV